MAEKEKRSVSWEARGRKKEKEAPSGVSGCRPRQGLPAMTLWNPAYTEHGQPRASRTCKFSRSPILIQPPNPIRNLRAKMKMKRNLSGSCEKKRKPFGEKKEWDRGGVGREDTGRGAKHAKIPRNLSKRKKMLSRVTRSEGERVCLGTFNSPRPPGLCCNLRRGGGPVTALSHNPWLPWVPASPLPPPPRFPHVRLGPASSVPQCPLLRVAPFPHRLFFFFLFCFPFYLILSSFSPPRLLLWECRVCGASITRCLFMSGPALPLVSRPISNFSGQRGGIGGKDILPSCDPPRHARKVSSPHKNAREPHGA